MKKVLGEIKSEVTVLARTEQILKSRAGDIDAFMRDLERQRGISGYSKVQDDIQKASEFVETLDNKKD